MTRFRSPPSALCGFAAILAASIVLAPPLTAAAQASSEVDHVCQNVMGLSAGEAHYGACVASLSDAARGADTGRQAALPADARASSYFDASPREVFRREQAACARMNRASSADADARCVAGLRSEMFAADHPSQ